MSHPFETTGVRLVPQLWSFSNYWYHHHQSIERETNDSFSLLYVSEYRCGVDGNEDVVLNGLLTQTRRTWIQKVHPHRQWFDPRKIRVFGFHDPLPVFRRLLPPRWRTVRLHTSASLVNERIGSQEERVLLPTILMQRTQMARPPYVDPTTNIIYDTDNPEYQGYLTKQSMWLKVSNHRVRQVWAEDDIVSVPMMRLLFDNKLVLCVFCSWIWMCTYFLSWLFYGDLLGLAPALFFSQRIQTLFWSKRLRSTAWDDWLGTLYHGQVGRYKIRKTTFLWNFYARVDLSVIRRYRTRKRRLDWSSRKGYRPLFLYVLFPNFWRWVTTTSTTARSYHGTIAVCHAASTGTRRERRWWRIVWRPQQSESVL